MTEDSIRPTGTSTLITEDLLLVLFQPDSGTIAGENTLFYVLAAGALTDLAQRGLVTVEDAGIRGTLVHAAGEPPEDALLRPMWDYVDQKPRDVQTVLAAIGPTMRQSVIDRLIEHGHLCTQQRRVLGLFPSTTLVDGNTGRRAKLVADMRAVLVDGAQPTELVAALIALVSASGSLPVLYREIPWSGTTASRAKDLEHGDWAAGAASAAVTRTMIAVVTNTIIAGAVVANR